MIKQKHILGTPFKQDQADLTKWDHTPSKMVNTTAHITMPSARKGMGTHNYT